MRNTRLIACCVVVLLATDVASTRGDEASAKASLADKGIRAFTSGVTLTAEDKFTKAVSSASSLKSKLQQLTYQQQVAEYENEEAEADIQELVQENTLLKKQQSQVARNFVYRRNRLLRWQLAQTIRSNTNEIALLTATGKQATNQAQQFRQSANSAREEFIEQTLDARALGDHLVRQYADLARDKDVTDALKEWNEAAGYSYRLKPSHKFETALNRLQILERGIVSDKVPLRREGKSYYATVTINGNQTCEMIVDTAAPTLVLPYQVAVAAGVNVNGAAETITGQVVKGANARMKHVLLDSVRVGKLTAEHVSCGVLPANAAAKPLLGMSFLGRFRFELNASTSQLSLLRVDAESPVVKRKKKTAHSHTVSKSTHHTLNNAP